MHQVALLNQLPILGEAIRENQVMSTKKLAGKVAAITGASKGIGAAIILGGLR
jgi:hypothetical protein